ncbi:phosphoribosyltransferase [Nocardiopsis sp. FR6]|uniref:phosphoribosyltransferase n=1 Tax=Nocardiopsis sp. FR6 TaxID=2605986 RepID=UPI00135A8F9D|nr:phosphoribosyltransferase family protein [Nocardiopsis sp. FR6]
MDYPTAVDASRLLARSSVAADAQIVVAVARGGLWPAAVIAAHLRLPVVSVSAHHNTGEGVRLTATRRASVSCPVDLEFLAGDRALIVDDIYGTGATLRAVRDAVPHLRSAPAVALCRNTGADGAPQAWVWDVADWVCFPWEDPPPATARSHPLSAPDTLHTSRRLP